MVKAPDGSELEIVWRLRDQQSLERELERIYGDTSGRERWVRQLVEFFYWRLQGHPREWPSASAPPSDHTARIFGVQIHYRVFPEDETVEVLSVVPAFPRRR
jgi:hypothetical protein